MNEINKLNSLPVYVWILLGLILLIQGTWVFIDASRRRDKNRWIWGFFALLNCPTNPLIYLLVTRIIMKTKKCSKCSSRINEKAQYCPKCGVVQKKTDRDGG